MSRPAAYRDPTLVEVIRMNLSQAENAIKRADGQLLGRCALAAESQFRGLRAMAQDMGADLEEAADDAATTPLVRVPGEYRPEVNVLFQDDAAHGRVPSFESGSAEGYQSAKAQIDVPTRVFGVDDCACGGRRAPRKCRPRIGAHLSGWRLAWLLLRRVAARVAGWFHSDRGRVDWARLEAAGIIGPRK